MKVKLLEFTILSAAHELYITDNFQEDADIDDANDKTLASFSVFHTSVYLRSTLSPSSAARSFFHEIYELMLSTLGFRYDPHDPHAAFSSMSDVFYGVVLENLHLFTGRTLEQKFRECIEEHFSQETEASAVEADAGPKQRHWNIGGFVLHLDEIDFSREKQYPTSAHFTVKELPSIVMKVKDLVSARDGKWDDDVDTAVKEVMESRDITPPVLFTTRHFEVGSFVLHQDEIAYTRMKLYPKSDPFNRAEIDQVVKIVREWVYAHKSKNEDDIDEAVKDVMHSRENEEIAKTSCP